MLGPFSDPSSSELTTASSPKELVLTAYEDVVGANRLELAGSAVTLTPKMFPMVPGGNTVSRRGPPNMLSAIPATGWLRRLGSSPNTFNGVSWVLLLDAVGLYKFCRQVAW